MFVPGYISQWRGDNHRIFDRAAYNWYVLNTNRMFEITTAYNGYQDMFFFDNPADSRDGGARMRLNLDLEDITDMADSPHGSESVTLDVFPNNDDTQTTTELTLQKAAIAYFCERDDDTCWLTYIDMGWEKQRVLVDETGIALWLMMFA